MVGEVDDVTPYHRLSDVYIFPSDMLELTGVLFVAVAVCYVVISRLLKSMKIAQALRLGEDS